MSFEKKSFNDIYQGLVAGTRQRLPGLNDFREGSVVRSLFESFAYELAVLYEQLDLVYGAGFVDTAEGANLDRVVAVLGIRRNEPDFASGMVTFERDKGLDVATEIPVGTLVTTEEGEGGKPPKKSYVTVEEAPIPAGGTSVDVRVQALERGRDQATDAGTVVVMPRPVPGIKSVTNKEGILFLGRDRETDEELRRRAKEALLASGRASTTAIETALFSMPGVLGVRVQEEYGDDGKNAGIVTVYVDGLTPDNQPALKARLDEVRAAGVYALLKPATPKPLKVSIKFEADPRIKGGERTKLEERVHDVVEAYIRRVPMGAPLLFAPLTGQVLGIQGVTDLTKFEIQATEQGAAKTYGLADKKIEAEVSERYAPDVFVADDLLPLMVDVAVAAAFPNAGSRAAISAAVDKVIPNRQAINALVATTILGLQASTAKAVGDRLENAAGLIRQQAARFVGAIAAPLAPGTQQAMVSEIEDQFDRVRGLDSTGGVIASSGLLARLRDVLSSSQAEARLRESLASALGQAVKPVADAAQAAFPADDAGAVLRSGLLQTYQAQVAAAQATLDDALEKGRKAFETTINVLSPADAAYATKVANARDALTTAQNTARSAFDGAVSAAAGARDTGLAEVPGQVQALSSAWQASLANRLAAGNLATIASDQGKSASCDLAVALHAVLLDGRVSTGPEIAAGILEKLVPGLITVNEG